MSILKSTENKLGDLENNISKIEETSQHIPEI